jgi:large subunit ribosomal protein L29
MPIEEIANKEMALREELSKLSFQHKIRPLENSSRLSFLRKDIARIQTLKKQLIVI